MKSRPKLVLETSSTSRRIFIAMYMNNINEHTIQMYLLNFILLPFFSFLSRHVNVSRYSLPSTFFIYSLAELCIESADFSQKSSNQISEFFSARHSQIFHRWWLRKCALAKKTASRIAWFLSFRLAEKWKDKLCWHRREFATSVHPCYHRRISPILQRKRTL